MDRFWQLLSESTLIQGALTLIVTSVWCYMLIAGLAIPTSLDLIVGTVIGFYFGNKSAQVIRAQQVRADQTKKDTEK